MEVRNVFERILTLFGLESCASRAGLNQAFEGMLKSGPEVPDRVLLC